jgi:hypothetical protein
MIAPPNLTTDVLVWGGGTGGIAAALQAARGGAATLLLTPGGWLGGMVSSAGVCCPDGNELSPWQTGLWGALLRELQREQPGGLDHNWVSCFGYRPERAEAILRRWLAAEANLTWWPGCRLLAVHRQGDRITEVVLRRGEDAITLQPQLVIDGSDRGDLLALADVPFRLGWEAREQWQEPSAPPQVALANDPFFQSQPVQSPTWVVVGQLTQDSAPNQVSPRGSDLPVLAEPFSGASEAFGLARTITYGRLPGGLVMLNWPLHGNDWHHGLARAFAGDPQELDPSLAAAMRDHSDQFAAALETASDGWLVRGAAFPTAAEALQGQLQGQEALALMPYWREGRRLVGLEVVVEQHLLPQGPGTQIAALPMNAAGATTAIAVGNYANDHHYPGPDWPLAPKSCRWGGRWSGTPFAVPYGALVSATVVNLLAADKNVSVSHMANGATRLQPLVLNLGQAAGQAAALCLQTGRLPAELPVRQLQQALIEDAQAPAGVVPLWDTPWHHRQWRQRQRAVLDDPSRLDQNGCLTGDPIALDPYQAPVERGEQLWRGQLRGDAATGYFLDVDGATWPLITLEPALHHWLQQGGEGRAVALIGCANPWGPWLRVSRLAAS